MLSAVEGSLNGRLKPKLPGHRRRTSRASSETSECGHCVLQVQNFKQNQEVFTLNSIMLIMYLIH